MSVPPNQLTHVLAALGQAVIAVDRGGVIFYANRAAEELLQWPAAELVGRNMDELDGSDAARARAAMPVAWQGEVVLRRRDGVSFPAGVSDAPIEDETGAVIGMVRVAFDVSARHADQHAQRLLANAGSALAGTLNYEHTIATLSNFVVPALADFCVIDVTGPDATARAAALLDHGEPTLIKGITADTLKTLVVDANERRRMQEAGVQSVIIAPFRAAGRTLGTLAVASATRTYGEDDLALVTELTRRAAFAIDNAMLYEAASMANQAKSDFLAVMSHELRTPLTTVMGYTDLLLANVAQQLEKGSQTYVERIRSAAWHLLGLIEQILIYARLEVGREQVHVEKARVERMLRDAAELIEPVAGEKGLEFELTLPGPEATIDTDVTKLRQILINLLANAVKFTESGKVQLEAQVLKDAVHFVVRDTGVGIAAEHQQRVFDSFWQVDQSATRKEGGTGIGLSVSRRLARLLGGDVAVQSEPGKGSTFILTLPRSA